MEIDKLIAECTAYDFKLMLEEKRPKSWLKSVSAFANGMGGSLFFGVADNREVVGLKDTQHVMESISFLLRDHMDPLPEVEIIPMILDSKTVIQLKVAAGKYTPYYYVGDGQRVAFVRIGDESVPASDEQMMRLVLKGSNRSFDSLKTDFKVENSAFTILANTFEVRVQLHWNRKYLKSFGLVTDDGRLTNAGVLFSDDCMMPQSRLYCTRWDGVEKTDALNDAEYKGNILMLLREAQAFVKSNTRRGWEKLPNGRRNKQDYAERAILEGLVNHFIHRDYTVVGGEVHLDIYDDRIVLTSPGGMYNGLMVQDLNLDDISSDIRNPVLADVMAQLDYMEKRGSGLRRILNETQRLDSYRDDRHPVFRSNASQFITTLYSMDYDSKESLKPALSWHQVSTKLALSRNEMEPLMKKMVDFVSAKDLRETMGWKDSTKFKKKFLNPLIECGLVELSNPDKPTSPSQRYRLTERGRALLEGKAI